MAVTGLGLSRISDTQFQVDAGSCNATVGTGTLTLDAPVTVTAADVLNEGTLLAETAYAVWLTVVNGKTTVVLSADFAALDSTSARRIGTLWFDDSVNIWPFTQNQASDRRAYTFQGPVDPRILLIHGTKTVWTPVGRNFFVTQANKKWKKMRLALSVTGGTGPTADYRAMNGSGEVHVIEPVTSNFSVGTQTDIFEYKSSGTGSTGVILVGLEETI